MKVTFKTLLSDQFEMDFDENASVASIKECIAKCHPDFTVEHTKLISAGKVLEDEQTLKEIKFKEGSFIVVFDQKKKDARPSDQSSRASPAATKESEPDPPVLLEMAQQREKLISELMDMGFDRESVSLALHASFFNPDRAVEYLLSGNIPSTAEEPMGEPAIPSAGQPDQAPSQDVPNSIHMLRSLRSQPQFQELRRVIRQNPEMLASVISQIGQAHPQLLEAIEQNEEEFLQMLTEENIDESERGIESDSPNTHIVRLTAEERAAIDRLRELGFSETACVQAYFACDKNENAAANFLFSANLDEDADSMQGGGS